jgi:hypothetical protein
MSGLVICFTIVATWRRLLAPFSTRWWGPAPICAVVDWNSGAITRTSRSSSAINTIGPGLMAPAAAAAVTATAAPTKMAGFASDSERAEIGATTMIDWGPTELARAACGHSRSSAHATRIERRRCLAFYPSNSRPDQIGIDDNPIQIESIRSIAVILAQVGGSPRAIRTIGLACACVTPVRRRQRRHGQIAEFQDLKIAQLV